MAKYTVYVGRTPMAKNVSHTDAIFWRDQFSRAGMPVRMVRVTTGTKQPKNDRLNRKRKRKAARKARKR